MGLILTLKRAAFRKFVANLETYVHNSTTYCTDIFIQSPEKFYTMLHQ